MRFRIIYNAWWMFWARGMTLWPWIWIKGDSMDDRLFRHELQHCYQIDRRGRLNFYVTYVWYQIRYGYKKNPFEIEAEMAETEPLLPKERAWKDKGLVTL